MTMVDALAPDRLAAALAQLPGWRQDGEALVATFRFADFQTAIAFMNDAAPEIHQLDHHPEWTNVYDRVTVRLTTHDAGNRITRRDVELAKMLSWVALRFADGPEGFL
jgi:4a-hydroxytetrahydrobiopterin dehydratase